MTPERNEEKARVPEKRENGFRMTSSFPGDAALADSAEPASDSASRNRSEPAGDGQFFQNRSDLAKRKSILKGVLKRSRSAEEQADEDGGAAPVPPPPPPPPDLSADPDGISRTAKSETPGAGRGSGAVPPPPPPLPELVIDSHAGQDTAPEIYFWTNGNRRAGTPVRQPAVMEAEIRPEPSPVPDRTGEAEIPEAAVPEPDVFSDDVYAAAGHLAHPAEMWESEAGAGAAPAQPSFSASSFGAPLQPDTGGEQNREPVRGGGISSLSAALARGEAEAGKQAPEKAVPTQHFSDDGPDGLPGDTLAEGGRPLAGVAEPAAPVKADMSGRKPVARTGPSGGSSPDLSAEKAASWEYGTEFDLSVYTKNSAPAVGPDGEALIRPETDPPGIPEPPVDAELAALRNMVLGRELALLERFKALYSDPVGRTREMSEVLPEAIVLTAAKDDEKIERALGPLVNKIFKGSLRRNPQEFANAIFPVMGPAIRRSIAETFRSMVESFQKSMEMAFSWKGLRMRIESIRTGRPFSEVVMLHTLIYRVEQLFLIHRATGLVLNHVVDEGVASQDADMVSAMLTAIQDFVRDCFASGQEGDLESLQLGDYTIIVEQSPYAYLACVVRGNPSIELRQSLRNSLELIQVEFLDELASFNGDSAPFAASTPLLEQCLVSRFHEDRSYSLAPRLVPVLTLLLIIAAFAFWRHSVNAESRVRTQAMQLQAEQQERFLQTMDAYVDRVRNEPGLLVVDVKDYLDPPWQLTCLKDDLAREPAAVLQEAGARPGDFTVSTVPYVSLEPAIVARRVADHIRPPENVRMEFSQDGTLRLSGTAPIDWIMRARQEALTTPGVKRLDFDGLSDPRMDQLRQLVREVESITVEFPLGKDTPVPRDAPKLDRAVTRLVQLEKLAAEMGISAQLTIYGHADSTGDAQRNYEISQARARTLAAMLYGKGSTLQVTMYGMGAEYAKQGVTSPQGDQDSRRIELRVHLARIASATPEDLR